MPQAGGEGQTIFQQKCTACHTIGSGDLVGPDLEGVVARRDEDWLTRWITTPDQMLAENDPIATQLLQQYNNIPMPNLSLTQSQVAAVIAYLQSTDQGQSLPPVVAAPALPQGDPAAGKELFTGNRRFQSGGPPCMACHSVSGIGVLGGGVLGPDLTQVFSKYGGETGLGTFLSTMPLPTMNTVWGQRPLASQEQADLMAFLGQVAVSERSPEAILQLSALTIIGTAAVLALTHLIWRYRLAGVRRPLVGQRSRALTAQR
ncbi:MAG: cytochrome c [Anaerolineae bacterium]|nr:cytochrome c [Anaerolineae bacterium]NUQ04564.1 c-type cytochrome [Anaerolineae bacterium]